MFECVIRAGGAAHLRGMTAAEKQASRGKTAREIDNVKRVLRWPARLVATPLYWMEREADGSVLGLIDGPRGGRTVVQCETDAARARLLEQTGSESVGCQQTKGTDAGRSAGGRTTEAEIWQVVEPRICATASLRA
jgi:hypothetical protein